MPRCSTTGATRRPLIALCSVSSNTPVPAGFSFRVSHFTRNPPVSLVNVSVCELPRPDQEAIGRQTIADGCGLASDRHAGVARIVHATRASRIIKSSWPSPLRECSVLVRLAHRCSNFHQGFTTKDTKDTKELSQSALCPLCPLW